jgi:pimeloyl-ACP methyl ester carboxylesterase
MDFVLIHGHGQTGAAWRWLRDILQHQGHRTHAPTLPNEPDWRAEDFAGFVATQTNVTNPVIVGNSGAGNLMAALAGALDARHLVWLAAVVPDWAHGTSFRETVQAHRDEIYHDEVLTQDGPFAGDDVASAYFLFHDCDLERLRFGLTTLRDFLPVGVVDEHPRRRELPPSTYLLPTGDRILRPDFMREMARERLDVEPIEVDGGHCAQLGKAELVAEVITRVCLR